MQIIHRKLKKISLRKNSIPVGFFLFVLFIAVSNAYAHDCGDLSPFHEDGSSRNMVINARDLDRSEQAALMKLFESLEGDWQGEAEEFVCHGRDNNDKRQDHFTIKAEASVDRHGNLKLVSHLYSPIKRSRHTEDIEFFMVDNKLRWDTDSAVGDIENLKVSKDKVEFTKKIGGSSGYQLSPQQKHELYVRLTKTSRGFTIEKRVFTRGKLNVFKIKRFTR